MTISETIACNEIIYPIQVFILNYIFARLTNYIDLSINPYTI